MAEQLEPAEQVTSEGSARVLSLVKKNTAFSTLNRIQYSEPHSVL
jgi:hypothetical protein